jgi:uncharacterized coiled-coil protein SlyX
MHRSKNMAAQVRGALGAIVIVLLVSTHAAASTTKAASGATAEQQRLDRLEKLVAGRIAADEKALAAQAKELAEQKAMIGEQQRQLASLRQMMAGELDQIRAAGDGPPQTTVLADNGSPAPSGSTAQPVGQAPPPSPEQNPQNLALPQGVYVLTPAGHVFMNNNVTYQNASSDRVVFEGVEIAGAVLVGALEANQTENNSVLDTQSMRVGLGKGFEIEGSIPWVARSDRVTTVQTANSSETQTFDIRGSGVGDAEVTARYQVTSGRPGEPIVIANLQVKSDSGLGPYDVPFDSSGVAQRLAVGSGFWSVTPTLTALLPSDPVILFGTLGYQYSFSREVNRLIGTAQVGRVWPGSSINGAVGFAFALNSNFSYSLGYKDYYFFPTITQLGGLNTASTNLQAGALLLGAAYRLNSRMSLNLNFEFGVTGDAPNDTVILTIPYYF